MRPETPRLAASQRQSRRHQMHGAAQRHSKADGWLPAPAQRLRSAPAVPIARRNSLTRATAGSDSVRFCPARRRCCGQGALSAEATAQYDTTGKQAREGRACAVGRQRRGAGTADDQHRNGAFSGSGNARRQQRDKGANCQQKQRWHEVTCDDVKRQRLGLVALIGEQQQALFGAGRGRGGCSHGDRRAQIDGASNDVFATLTTDADGLAGQQGFVAEGDPLSSRPSTGIASPVRTQTRSPVAARLRLSGPSEPHQPVLHTQGSPRETAPAACWITA